MLEYLPKPTRVLKKGDPRILLNGKVQPFRNKRHQITFSKAFKGKNVTGFLKKMLAYIPRNEIKFTRLADDNWNMDMHVLIRADFSFMDQVVLDAEDSGLLSRLKMKLKIDTVHRNIPGSH